MARLASLRGIRSRLLLIGLSSRILIIVVVMSVFLLFNQNMYAERLGDTPPLPFIDHFSRWDSGWYINIGQCGYIEKCRDIPLYDSSAAGTPLELITPQWAFFPLYPAAMLSLALPIAQVMPLRQSLLLSGVVISNIAMFVSLYFFYKLTKRLFNQKVAEVSSVFFSFWVGGVFYSYLFSEALFMAFALGSFYYLQENKLPKAILLGFLASFTRSDGFLIFIPFAVYAIQQLTTDKLRSAKLAVSSAAIASPYIIWNMVGYGLYNVFPIQMVTHQLYWGNYQFLLDQFKYYDIPSNITVFYLVGWTIMIAPTVYFLLRIEKVMTLKSRTLGYWVFYFALLFIVFKESYISSVFRYTVPMLPIYWFSAKIYIKNRKIGIALLAVNITLVVVGCYLLEMATAYFL
jgi:hypothetical protein